MGVGSKVTALGVLIFQAEEWRARGGLSTLTVAMPIRFTPRASYQLPSLSWYNFRGSSPLDNLSLGEEEGKEASLVRLPLSELS